MALASIDWARLAKLAPVLIPSTILVYFIFKALYNVLFHPLRKYPGPKLWAASRVPLALAQMSGKSIYRILELHHKYGDVVRIAPNELSYNNPTAFNDIYGHRKHGEAENGKDPIFYHHTRENIIGSNREEHARWRRILSHGFSAQALRAQEPLIKVYVDQLMDELRAHSGEAVNLVRWFNFTTFDIIGDLAFADPFGCLATNDYHPWVAMIFDSIKAAMLMNVARRFPLFESLLMRLIPRSIIQKREATTRMTSEKVAKRKDLGSPRPDFMESMLAQDGPNALTDAQLQENARILIVAGSETTATALSGMLYSLMMNRAVLEKLVHEIRTSFGSEDEINMLLAQKLPYLNAAIEEGLRMYPPVPIGLPRLAPVGGASVLGQYVPAKTLMSVWHWPLYHNAKWFSQPESFIPERWLGDARFAGDRRDGLLPFSTGPRNCLGKNLAYAELRLILARFFWNFDVEIDESSRGWMAEQETYTLWDKGELLAYVKPRKVE